MCQTADEGGRRCPTHTSGSQAVSYEAEREYGISENVIRKVLSIFRKEAIHNGISDKINASAQSVKAFIKERTEAVRNAVNMNDAEKRTAMRRWTRAAKEKVSMATLYSWKKTSALMAAGSMAVLLSACSGTGEDTKNLPEGDTTPAATASADPTEGATQSSMDEVGGAFGYNYDNIDVPEDIQERYGKEASANIVNDAFVPMQVIKSNQGLYDSSEKSMNTYLPLKPYLTPEAWDREASDYSGDTDNDNPILSAYALTCTAGEDSAPGEAYYVKDGHEATANAEDYEIMVCDSEQNISENVSLDDVTVHAYSTTDEDNLSDAPEHLVVSGKMSHVIIGKSSDGQPVSQEHVTEFQSFMLPDPQKENHWLIDGSNWKRDYGKTTYNE